MGENRSGIKDPGHTWNLVGPGNRVCFQLKSLFGRNVRATTSQNPVIDSEFIVWPDVKIGRLIDEVQGVERARIIPVTRQYQFQILSLVPPLKDQFRRLCR